ncbi:MAG TPA: autotransporter assembly complex family protein [Motiliproteus sp.]
MQLSLFVTYAHASPVVVELMGLEGALERNALAHLSINNADTQLLSATRIKFLHSKASHEIQKALEPFGYYNVEISSELQQAPDTTLARYRVTLGPQTLIHEVQLHISGDGDLDPAFRALTIEPGITPGDPLRHARYNKVKQRLQSIAAERGYYDAKWNQQQIIVNREQHQADIALHLDSGPRYRYREFRFSPTELNPDFLSRYITSEPGDPVFIRDLQQLQTRLNNSDYFQRVEVHPNWEERAAGDVPIDIELEMRQRTRYRAGVGFDTDTRSRLTAGMTRRWVNDKGHNFDALVQPGELRTDASFQYNIPGVHPEYEQYSLRSAYRREVIDPIDSETFASGISWQSKWYDWVQVIGIDIERESFDFDATRQRSHYLLPRISWSRTVSDNRVDVSQGYRIKLELLGATDAWYSDSTFLQGRIAMKGVYSLTPAWRLLARSELGATINNDVNQLPASKRFFAGGDNSVRGYSYKSIAPENESGNVEGGQGLAVFSLETDYRLSGNWRAALFVDHGAAINSLDSPLSTGVGSGLRWQSPIGPVRLDLAWALSKDDTPWRLHFSIGPDL